MASPQTLPSTLTATQTATATSKEKKPAESSKDNECAVNDPDFAIICAFLQKFAKDVGLEVPNFTHLHEWLINSDEVSPQLRDLHIKLLRKTRKTVHEKSWESALSKFCFTYCAQDAWEIERFGYKKSSLKVKLRILKELLESQFERNNKFRQKLLTHSADSLRSEPIGRDKLGHTYWLTQDEDCNLRIYQEHLDEEIWRVVASNREELVNLIARLRGNEVVLPSAEIGTVDEDSSSNSCAAPIERPPPPEEQDDSQEEPALKVPNLRIKLAGTKNRMEQETVSEKEEEGEKAKPSNEGESNQNVAENSMDEPKPESSKKVKPLFISQLGGSSPNISSSSKRRNNDEDSTSPPSREEQFTKRSRPSLLDSRRSNNKPSKYFERDEDEDEEASASASSLESEEDTDEECEEEDMDSAAAEEDENEVKDIEDFDDDDDDDNADFNAEVSEPVEDPPVYVNGNGLGHECNAGNQNDVENEMDCANYLSHIDVMEETIFGDVVEESVMFVFGEGSGADCLVGDKGEDEQTAHNEPKAAFFFGVPGCLKLSPIKVNSLTTSSDEPVDEGSEESEQKLEIKEHNTQCDKEIPITTDETIVHKEDDVSKSSNEGKTHEEPAIERAPKLNGNKDLIIPEKSEDVVVALDNSQTDVSDEKKPTEKNDKTTSDTEASVSSGERVPIETEIIQKSENKHPKDSEEVVEEILADKDKPNHNLNKQSNDDHSKDDLNKDNNNKEDLNSDAHTKDDHSKDEHNKDEHNKDEHNKDDHSKDEHKKDDHNKDEHNKDDHNKDEHTKEGLNKDDHNKEGHNKDHNIDNHNKDNHSKDSEKKDEGVASTSTIESGTPKIADVLSSSNDEKEIVDKSECIVVETLEKSIKTPEKMESDINKKDSHEEIVKAPSQKPFVESNLTAINSVPIAIIEEQPKIEIPPQNTQPKTFQEDNIKVETKNAIALANHPQDEEKTANHPQDEEKTAKEQLKVEIFPVTTTTTKAAPKITAKNRKRRLTDPPVPLQHQQATSESDLDPHTEPRDEAPHKEEEEDTLEDIGGKRPKMRAKCSNLEIRKKVEAKMFANLEETTSSSGDDEDAREPRKSLSPTKKEPQIEKLTEKGITPNPSTFIDTSKLLSRAISPVTASKPYPHLSEITENQLQKTPPKPEEPGTSLGTVFVPPKKSPITKPLKKSLLTQLRESDEEAIPRKRTLSNAASLDQNRQDTLLTTESKEESPQRTLEPKIIKEDEKIAERRTPEKQFIPSKTTKRNSVERITPERQRKRQNSEEPSVENTASVEFETSSNTDSIIKKSRETADEVEMDTQTADSNDGEKKIELSPKIISEKKCTDEEISPVIPKTEQSEEHATGSVGRRSSRRCASSVIYSELPQVKRTRAVAKSVSKPDVKKEEKLDKKTAEAEVKSEKETDKETEKPLDMNEKSKETVETSDHRLESELPKQEIKLETKTTEVASPTKEKSKDKNVEKLDDDDDSLDNVEDQIKVNVLQKPSNSPPTVAPLPIEIVPSTSAARGRGRGPRKKREVDATNIIDEETETPVRQSRRIAQQKIREEAERRKLEEIALRTMKQELKKKKKAEKEADPTVLEPSEHSSSASSSESEVETKKKSKKKCPGKDGGWSSGSEEVEEPEEEDEYPHHYESDAGSPLFKSDHEFSPESELEDETQVVPMKRARTARKEDADDQDQDTRDEEACQKCGKSDHPEWILLCDICDKGYHCSCLSPVLFYIPEGDWFCPPCQQEQLIAALEKQLKDYDETVERKRIANEEEARLAELAKRAEQERLKYEEEQRKERRKNKQKKRHRGDDSSERGSSAESDNERKKEKDKSEESEEYSKGSKVTGGFDADSENESKSSKPNNKRNVDKAEKNKRRRGEGRNRRRRAAARGARRRRRLDKSSGSGSENSSSNSGSSSQSKSASSSDSFSDSDDEPIYKLRKRRQINVSYRLNEYDDLINSALKKEMDEVAGAGNAGRGKDISTIIEADKEEKARLKEIERKGSTGDGESVKDEQTAEESKIKETEKNQKSEKPKEEKDEEEESDDEKPLINKSQTKTTIKKKPRKLTTLDISSEEDNASDEDFKTSSFDDEDEEEDTSISASTDSDSSLEVFRRRGRGKGGKKKQRKAARKAARERRKVKKFVVEESSDDEVIVKTTKKKRKDESETETESETDDNDDDLSELSENIDSADLCDDTTSESSDDAWHPSKRKKQRKGTGGGAQKSQQNAGKQKKPQAKKVKQLEYSDDDISETEEEEDDDDDDGIKGSGKQPRSKPLIPVKSSKSNNGGMKGKTGKPPVAVAKERILKKRMEQTEQNFSDSSDSNRKTRGRRYAYLEDFDDDSSDGGIKPGVKRPDTPPEEREKFIKKQEEIKRMLAEKNAEGAKLAATPRLTPIKAVSEQDRRSSANPVQDSLSTVPLSVIRQAKVLDQDYLQRKGQPIDQLEDPEEVDSEFDDADLPDDLPEDMDEDAIARMVEEEEEEEFGNAATAARDLPAPDEVLRTPNKSKAKESATTVLKSSTNPSLEALSQMQGGTPTPVISVQTATTAPQTTTTTTTAGTLSGLQEPVRKRLPMPTLHPPLLRHHYTHPPHTQSGNIMLHAGAIPRPPAPPPSHLLENALSTPLGQALNRNFPMQHASPMPARQLLPPTRPIPTERPSTSMASATASASADTEIKPRGRRKKITPLRDPTQKQVSSAALSSPLNAHVERSSPSEAHSNNRASTVVSNASSVIKTSASVLHQPQLYKPPGDLNLGSEAQTSVITRMPHLPPGRMIFPGADVARFYGALPPQPGAGGPRQLPSNTQRPHRGPPLQMPPGLPPPPISAASYVPPHARHAPSHLNPYRPPIYGNPSFGQPRSMPPTTLGMRIGTPPGAGPEYLGGPRPFNPYGYYPPPPPLTSTHLSAAPSSVIVAAPSSANAPPVITANPTISTIIAHASSEAAAPISDPKSSPAEEMGQSLIKKRPNELMTLEAYTSHSNAKSPMAIGGGESSGSQPETAEDSPTSMAQPQSKAGEFSGLVSYFSSQHDDYNS